MSRVWRIIRFNDWENPVNVNQLAFKSASWSETCLSSPFSILKMLRDILLAFKYSPTFQSMITSLVQSECSNITHSKVSDIRISQLTVTFLQDTVIR